MVRRALSDLRPESRHVYAQLRRRASIPSSRRPTPVQAVVERSIREHVSFECEYRVIRPDGVARTVHALGAWRRADGEGETVLYGTAQDITDRKQIEDALRESETRLRRCWTTGNE